MSDFYVHLGQVGEKLNGMVGNITDSEVLALYRIEVHALKSTSANVGALLLSKLSRLCESAAIAGDIEKIKTLHPILTEEIITHKNRLETVVPQNDEKIQIDNKDEIIGLLNTLNSSLKNDDFDSADFLCSELLQYEYPDNIQNFMNELSNKIMNLESEDAIMVIDIIKKEFEV